MNHTIEWDNQEKTVLLQRYLPGATKDDLYHLTEKSRDMMATVNHTVHLIVDEREINLKLVSVDLRFMERKVPANQGHCVVVVRPERMLYKRYVQELSETTAPMTFKNSSVVSSVEQAREYLESLLEPMHP